MGVPSKVRDVKSTQYSRRSAYTTDVSQRDQTTVSYASDSFDSQSSFTRTKDRPSPRYVYHCVLCRQLYTHQGQALTKVCIPLCPLQPALHAPRTGLHQGMYTTVSCTDSFTHTKDRPSPRYVYHITIHITIKSQSMGQTNSFTGHYWFPILEALVLFCKLKSTMGCIHC